MSNQNNDSYITVWVSFRVVHASKRYVELWSDCSYQQPGGLAVGTVHRRTDCPLHSNTIHIQHCHCTTLLPAHNPPGYMLTGSTDEGRGYTMLTGNGKTQEEANTRCLVQTTLCTKPHSFAFYCPVIKTRMMKKGRFYEGVSVCFFSIQ